ncbi:alpha/beta hydrolase [Vibrio palustris]|uniref:Putative hydrolase n=1 Tax=Vibrio palustris TaxID=1918946 RepID=A0A1R4B4I8_9VIBR|nr:alpha/beta fold hydrolase [Vibrio palustris]SJL83838.1 putative hydrolase [Vibrio palustris]
MTTAVFLHGLGANGRTFHPIINMLDLDTNIHVACPDAPYPHEGSEFGKQWYSSEGNDEQKKARLDKSIERLVQALQQIGNLEDMVLIGFSQGAIIALHAVAKGLPVKGVVSIAGKLYAPVKPRDSWPSMVLLHDNQDPVIPVTQAQQTYQWLKDAGAEPEAFLSNDVGHSISAQMLPIIRQAIMSHHQ